MFTLVEGMWEAEAVVDGHTVSAMVEACDSDDAAYYGGITITHEYGRFTDLKVRYLGTPKDE